MARLISNRVLRGMSYSSNNAKVLVAASCMKHMRSLSSGFSTSGFDTRITSGPDTHEDFQPTNKSSGISLLDVVQQDVKENPVMIYMKGFPHAPRCGFSALAVKVLQQYGVPIRARDILGDLKLKESVKSYTNWPTFPQIFIKGKFVGGSDIVLNMHQDGELQELLADLKHDDSQPRE